MRIRLAAIFTLAVALPLAAAQAEGTQRMLVYGQDVLPKAVPSAGKHPKGLIVYSAEKATFAEGAARLDVFARNDTDQELTVFFVQFPAHPMWQSCTAQFEGEGITLLRGPQGPEVYDGIGRPPNYSELAVPPRATIRFMVSAALNSIEYRGHPTAKLRWDLRFVDAGATGTVPVQLPLAPIQVAARNGWRDDVAEALAAGADIDAPDIYGNSALQNASDKDQIEVVHLLLQKHAKVGGAIFAAASRGHVRVLEALLAAGSTVDARDNEQKTPLHWAAVNGYAEAVALLVKHGADPKAKDKWGHTPIELAGNLPPSNSDRAKTLEAFGR